MATPKKRLSPVRSGNRRRQIGISLPATATCSNCGAVIVRHQACKACGFYRGRAAVAKATPTLPSK